MLRGTLTKPFAKLSRFTVLKSGLSYLSIMKTDDILYWDAVNPANIWPWVLALFVTVFLLTLCCGLLTEIVSEFSSKYISYFCP